MRVLLYGRNTESLAQLLAQYHVEVITDRPDVVITHGGDGTLLEAERLYPGVPKLPIRHESICKNCINHETSHVVKLLVRGELSQHHVMKIETKVKDKTLIALNEISLYHQIPNQAIRFTVKINNERKSNNVIGDGVIIATPFGSHGYYRSVTKSTFRSGIGVAYNHTTEPIDHIVLRESDVVTVKLERGPAYLLVDNDTEMLTLEAGEQFTVCRSNETALLLGLDHSECPDCGEIESHMAVEGK